MDRVDFEIMIDIVLSNVCRKVHCILTPRLYRLAWIVATLQVFGLKW